MDSPEMNHRPINGKAIGIALLVSSVVAGVVVGFMLFVSLPLTGINFTDINRIIPLIIIVMMMMIIIPLAASIICFVHTYRYFVKTFENQDLV